MYGIVKTDIGFVIKKRVVLIDFFFDIPTHNLQQYGCDLAVTGGNFINRAWKISVLKSCIM
jgi:hypothetical protein